MINSCDFFNVMNDHLHNINSYVYNSLLESNNSCPCDETTSTQPTLQMVPCAKCGCYFAPSWSDKPPYELCQHCKGGDKNG